MTYFLQSGTRFDVTSKDALNLKDELPVGTYTIKQDPRTGAYFLEEVAGFSLPPVIYGNTTSMADRIFNTFTDRPKGTGVLLAGEKGSGKTLLAELLSDRGATAGMPTILINSELYGEEFNSFVSNIDQPVVVIFDEFEKVYSKPDSQERLLTLLDGVYPSKKLFILTVNDVYRVNEHMNNRPGRLFYKLEFSGLGESEIREYCERNLTNQDNTEGVVKISSAFLEFNFDILKAMVEEMNRYDETASEVMKFLNASPKHNGDATFQITSFTLDGKTEVETSRSSEGITVNPFEEFNIQYKEPNNSLPEDSSGGDALDPDLESLIGSRDWHWEWARFEAGDIVSVKDKTFMFKNSEGVTLTLERSIPNSYGRWMS